jgi:type VI secretion system protein
MQRHSVGPSLYEKLTGNFANGTAIDQWNERTQTLLSVMDNISVILNSRQGALKHLPDYGLPDLTMIYRHLPASAHQMKMHISRTLLKYEPRLKSIDVELLAPGEGALLSYELVCHLKQAGLVRFGTYFIPDGNIRVESL